MSAQIESAQADIEKRLGELQEMATRGGDQSAFAQAKSQLTALARLQKRVSDADVGTLFAMRSEVSAMVAATQAVASSGTSQDVKAMQLAQVTLRQASEAARSNVQSFVRDFYENRMFDKYLTFASAGDEEDYRKREQERREAIEKALAEKTPQGNLRALDLSIVQMDDAGAHGASKSPQFKSRYDAMKETRKRLAAALDKEHARQLPAGTNDVEAAKPDASVSPELIAGLRASGVAMPDQSGSGHGVVIAKPPGAGRTPA